VERKRQVEPLTGREATRKRGHTPGHKSDLESSSADVRGGLAWTRLCRRGCVVGDTTPPLFWYCWWKRGRVCGMECRDQGATVGWCRYGEQPHSCDWNRALWQAQHSNADTHHSRNTAHGKATGQPKPNKPVRGEGSEEDRRGADAGTGREGASVWCVPCLHRIPSAVLVACTSPVAKFALPCPAETRG
jgi:hypothetical protein